MSRVIERDMLRDEPATDVGGDGNVRPVERLRLSHYVQVLRKYNWQITLFTAAITGLAAYYAFSVMPVYRATSTLLIESQQTNIVSIEDLVGAEIENQDYFQTQLELLRSRGLARRVIERLGLWNREELTDATPADRADGAPEVDAATEPGGAEVDTLPTLLSDRIRERVEAESRAAGEEALDVAAMSEDGPIVKDGFPATPDADALADASAASDGPPTAAYVNERGVLLDERKLAVVRRFMSRLDVQPVPKTKLVLIHFESTDPVLAAHVANAVGEEYITSYLDARMELTTKASTWLDERLAMLEVTLDESEERLLEFKRENGLVDVDGSVGRLNEQELLLVTAELAKARSELSSAADLYRETQALVDDPRYLQSLPTVQAHPLVQNVNIERGRAQRELDELLNRYGEKHPRVIDARSRIASLEATMQSHVRRVADSIAKDYQLLQQRVASIERELDVGKRAIQAIGTQKFELDALEREVATNQNIYDTFFSRMTEARSADGLEQANAIVSDYATPPRLPIKPNKELIISLAALGSLLLSVLLAVLHERMDDTVKSTSDIEDALGMRLVGILPLVKGKWFSRRGELPLNPSRLPDRNGVFVEAVNTARTAIAVHEGERPRRIVLVTSSLPGEGKSTTAINLAYSFAQQERVLLIDCDLRRPTIARAAGLEFGDVGLTSLITGSSMPRQCLKRGVFDGLVDVIPSGPIPERPLELLSSVRFSKILDKLAERYDRIIVDCAPMQAVSDAIVLSRLSDAVIYVVKSHDTSMDLVRSGVQRLRQVNAPLVGALITQVDIEKVAAYGGDYHYQSYYGHYGQGTDREGEGGKGRLHLSHEELLNIRTDHAEVELDFGDESPTEHGEPPETEPDPGGTVPSSRRAVRRATTAIERSARGPAPRLDAG